MRPYAVAAAWLCVPLAFGCDKAAPVADRIGFVYFPARPNRQVDVLFMVGDSAGMGGAQVSLQAALPWFMDPLKDPPGGPLDLHIAVVSSDMGAGDGSLPNCSRNGDGGLFRNAVGALANCTETGLNPRDRFIVSTRASTPNTNFTGDITQVLQCIVPLGTMGCGYGQPLASIARALGADRQQAPAENRGFLRPDGTLAIIMVSGEDDCSSHTPEIFSAPDSASNPLGPNSFRCQELGHLCRREGGGLAPPLLSPPNGMAADTVSYDSCQPSEDGRLTRVGELAANIMSLKVGAGRILVASFQGPAVPYRESWAPPAVATDPPLPSIAHSCVGSSGAFGDPGVRLQQFVQSFGLTGMVNSVCNNDYGPALGAIAGKLLAMVNDQCIEGPSLRDSDADPTNGIQPACQVFHSATDIHGGTVETPVEACAANGNQPPCWTLTEPEEPTSCRSGSHVFRINRGGVEPPEGLYVALKYDFL